MCIDDGAHFAALGETRRVDAAGQREVAHGVVISRRIAAEGKGAERCAEVARASVGRGLIGDENVGREVGARAELVGDDAAHAGVLDRRAGPVAGEHRVRAAFVGRLAVRHRADDGNLVGDLGRFLQVFRKIETVDAGLNGFHGAAVFDRSRHLRVERLLVGHAAGEVNIDDRLCSAETGCGEWRDAGRVGLRAKQIAHGHPDGAEQADVEKFAATRLPEVRGDGRLHAMGGGNRRTKWGGSGATGWRGEDGGLRASFLGDDKPIDRIDRSSVTRGVSQVAGSSLCSVGSCG